MTADGAPPPVPRLRLNQRVLGFFAAENQIVLAVVLLGLVNQLRDQAGPPEPVDRGLALGLIYALPAVVGGLGAWAGRRSLLSAAAVACTVGSVLSVATLLFLIPALLFAFAAIAPRAATSAPPPADAAPRPRRDWSGAIRSVGLAIVLAALMVGSGLALLTLTEARCWIGEENPSGVVVYRIVPDIYGVSEGKGETAGCSSAVLTVQGALVAAVLGVAALGLAIRATRPRRPDDSLDDRPGPPLVADAEITT